MPQAHNQFLFTFENLINLIIYSIPMCFSLRSGGQFIKNHKKYLPTLLAVAGIIRAGVQFDEKIILAAHQRCARKPLNFFLEGVILSKVQNLAGIA
jgi:hypothetical protein